MGVGVRQAGECVVPVAGAPPQAAHTWLFPSPSPGPGSLSVVWCYWTEPVGLSPGKVPLPPWEAWGLGWTLGRERPPLAGTAGNLGPGHRARMSQGRGPEPRGRQSQPIPAWAATKNDKRKRQAVSRAGLQTK